MNNPESLRIFTESSEDMGLLYDSYKHFPTLINDFMQVIEDSISKLINDPENSRIDLTDEIKQFKTDINVEFKHSPINMREIRSMRKAIKNFRRELDYILDRLSKLKNRVSFGGNFIRAILLRPKVYSKEINYDAYEAINVSIRNVDRSLDWIEKIIIDLYNMSDQDLNILTIVDKIYRRKHIYEAGYSDRKSLKDTITESFNWIDNFVHDVEFRENSYNTMIELRDPHALMTWMRSNIKYGWKSLEDGKIHGTNENEDVIYFFNHYRLQSPNQLTKTRFGVCWDQCELERRWFGKNGIEHGVFYIELQDQKVLPTHTFLVYKMNDYYWWFEHSWLEMKGIRKYNDLRSLILDVVLKHQAANNDRTSPVYVSWLEEAPNYGLTCEQYMNYAHNQKQLDVNNLPYNFNESVIDTLDEDLNNQPEEFVPVYGIACTYTRSKLRNDGTEKEQKDLEYIKFSKDIKMSTLGDNYSHALVSLDDTFTKMYSYDDYEGFTIDNIQENKLWMGTESIYICVMFVKKEDLAKMQKFVDYLTTHKDETEYAYSNLLQLAIGKPSKVDKRFICSSIAGYLLNMADPKNLHRDYSRLRPEDITILPRAFYVMNVRDREEFNQRHAELQSKVKTIYKEHFHEIDDYNNHLPKLMLQDRVDELKTIDKIFNWILKRIL